jgi:serine/threonine protein kinase
MASGPLLAPTPERTWMEGRVDRLRIGPYRLVRRLESGSLAERWLAFNEQDQTSHVGHRIRLAAASEARRFVAALESLSPLTHPHLLPIEQFSLGAGNTGWIVTPFTGSHDGLVTLPGLLRAKGGRMSPVEVERALTQIFDALDYAHSVGHLHGAIAPAEILVDRRGSLSVELYGLRRRLIGPGDRPPMDVVADEVRSLIEIGYLLLTGLPAEDPRIEASRLLPKLDRRWDEFFADGLDPLSGFPTASDALASLPSVKRELDSRTGPVQVVIRGVKRALKQP